MKARRAVQRRAAAFVLLALIVTGAAVATSMIQRPPSPAPIGGMLGLLNGRLVLTAALSPNGKSLAYAIEGNGSEVRAADMPSGKHDWAVAVVDSVIFQMEWSPSGREIALVAKGKLARLFVCEVDGSGCRVVATAEDMEEAHWNPAGSALVFSALTVGGWNVHTTGSHDGLGTQLTHTGEDHDGRWSTNGTHILFARFDSGGSNVWEVDLQGREEELTSMPGMNRLPAEAADGRLAFASNATGVWTVFVGKNGSYTDILVEGRMFSDAAAVSTITGLQWSPAGGWVAFDGVGLDLKSHVFVTNLNGTVIGPTSPDLPLDQQVYDTTTYHTPLTKEAVKGATWSAGLLGWASRGSGVLVVSRTASSLFLVPVKETVEAFKPYG